MSKPLHSSDHGLINYIDTEAKCCHLKNWPEKGLCGRCLQSLWRYSQSCWYFRPSFVKCRPTNFLCGSTLPPPPFPVSKYSIYRQCVAEKGWGMLSPVGDHILQEINILSLTRFRTCKIAKPPQTKIYEWKGPQTDKHLPQRFGHLKVV
jgi:hypothetical protein